MNNAHFPSLCIITSLFLVACTSTPEEQDTVFKPAGSYLLDNDKNVTVENAELIESAKKEQSESQAGRFNYVKAFQVQQQRAQVTDDVIDQFSDTRELKIASDGLGLSDYLHQVLGEQLKVSYILSDEIKNDTQSVTLNIQQSLTERKLFILTEKLLDERGYTVRFNDNIFYIHKKDTNEGQKDVTYGYGNQLSDIPETSGEIVQMIPYEFGLQLSMSNTLRQMIGVKSTTDTDRNSINVFGKRNEVIKALELIQLLDRPAFVNRRIGVYESTYVNGKDLLDKLTELLKQEGIKFGKGLDTSNAISAVNIEKQGKLVFFASSDALIERAVYWAKQIDKPIDSAEKQYFIYQPQYSRAIDMGESLESLIGGGTSRLGNSTSAAAENEDSSSRRGTLSASSEDLKMVIDERSNAVIFYTTSEKYQQLLPLVKRLDVLPKQVMLEVVIAEVSLTDEFKRGVEFSFSDGSYRTSTTGAFMDGGFGGLSYFLNGPKGNLAISLFESNSLVNILSRPSLVVRDGVNATITVGTDIPIISSTTIDPLDVSGRQTTNVEYRKTGVELGVTPTVNAQGVVLMEIKQKISNEVRNGSTLSGNPSVFERTIDTEVVAQNGQTIILGGLISENRTAQASSVPFFSSLPIIGNLFKADTRDGDKTELIVLVTPRVIESSSEWDDIKDKFENMFENLKIQK
ncbi:secretin N-terminal domain-containing protein [Pseudoalteromonas sp. TB64]|uniref:secretin N-terminal domain-containing protein n=1 Tax=Pseudoalteromonas sp. TB64 TaxID=1938600 RepID=UPI0004264FB2|nr:secretin N-terminal domain-containing protein [Pseudoalteromonas sp. TB64]